MFKEEWKNNLVKILKKEIQLNLISENELSNLCDRFNDNNVKDELLDIFHQKNQNAKKLINKIVIHNLFNHYSLKFEIDKNFSAIIGPNGIGKSSILSLISFIFCGNKDYSNFSSSFINIPFAFIEINDEFRIWKRYSFDKISDYSFEIENFKNGRRSTCNVNVHNAKNRKTDIKNLKKNIMEIFDIDTNIYFDYPLLNVKSNNKDLLEPSQGYLDTDSSCSRFILNTMDIDNNIANKLKNNFKGLVLPIKFKEIIDKTISFFTSIGVESLIYNLKIIIKDSIFYLENEFECKNYSRRNFLGMSLIIKYYEYMVQIKLLKEIFDSLYLQDQITSKELHIIGDSYGKSEEEIKMLIESDMFNDSYAFPFWSFHNNNKLYNMNLLSFGEKKIFNLLVNLIFEEKDLYILDEPENALHIEWQEKLIHIFEEVSDKLGRNCQFICATHSPFIGDGDESVFVVPKNCDDEIFDNFN